MLGVELSYVLAWQCLANYLEEVLLMLWGGGAVYSGLPVIQLSETTIFCIYLIFVTILLKYIQLHEMRPPR